MTESVAKTASPLPEVHYTAMRPSTKMDARGLAEGTCTCGYVTAPGQFAQAAKAVQMHFEAKHSHANAASQEPS